MSGHLSYSRPFSSEPAADSDGSRQGRQLWAHRHERAALAEKTRRNRADSRDYRPVGDVRRKPEPLRRQMACAGAGAILSNRWSGVGIPVETSDQVDPDRVVPRTPLNALKLLY